LKTRQSIFTSNVVAIVPESALYRKYFYKRAPERKRETGRRG